MRLKKVGSEDNKYRRVLKASTEILIATSTDSGMMDSACVCVGGGGDWGDGELLELLKQLAAGLTAV